MAETRAEVERAIVEEAASTLAAVLRGDLVMVRFHLAALAMLQAQLENWDRSVEERTAAMAAAFDARFSMRELVRAH